jgi:pimeloyl-ACP methyl ester carboxylesterase
MPLEHVPSSQTDYHLMPFDARGRERGGYSREVLRLAASRPPTDVFVFSHGWNGDVPAARAQYGAWVATMLRCPADLDRVSARRGGFRPLLIGLHWPSKAWGDEELTAASFGVDEPGPSLDHLVDQFAARLDADPTVRAAVWTIVEAAQEHAAPRTLPENVRAAYHVVSLADGTDAPEGDREPFDPERMYQACLLEQAVSFGGLSIGGLLAPLRVLTFWHMKRRARLFGESGATKLVADLQDAAPQARIHLMGHSFGAIVAAAAACGAHRPVDSLSLVQGAISLWSFCSSIPNFPTRTGYFHRLIRESRVAGPVVVTTSPFDRAVGTFYPLGAWSGRQIDYVGPEELPRYGAIGTFGVRGPDVEVEDTSLEDTDELRAGVVHNLDARDVIASGGGMSGAHNDICHPQVAHAVWTAVHATHKP